MDEKILIDASFVERTETIIKDVIGSDWIDKRVKQFRKYNDDMLLRTKNGEKYILPEDPHPIILLFHFADMWIENAKNGISIDINENVIRLIHLADELSTLQYIPNSEKEIDRLKNPEQYQSTLFEIEVATMYYKKGETVSFILEKGSRTSDLAIQKDGISVFVECKNREALSDRDKSINNVWERIRTFAMGLLKHSKIAIFLYIMANEDPIEGDYLLIKNKLIEIFDIISTKPANIFEKKITIGNGKYEMMFLDSAKYPAGLVPLPFTPDSSCMEVTFDSSVDRNILKTISISFKNKRESDITNGIMNAFKSARGQIPESGPGIIWIKLPDNLPRDYTNKYEVIKSKIEKELSGNENRRVNKVILYYKTWNQETEGNRIGVRFTPNEIEIYHNNPRQPISGI